MPRKKKEENNINDLYYNLTKEVESLNEPAILCIKGHHTVLCGEPDELVTTVLFVGTCVATALKEEPKNFFKRLYKLTKDKTLSSIMKSLSYDLDKRAVYHGENEDNE